MDDYPILSSTPIKETIFTISYSETIPFDNLKLFSQKEEIVKSYETVIDGFSTQVAAMPGQKPSANINSDGYILKCSKEDKIIQARQGSFSFHKVNKYEKFDTLLSELIYLWNLLVFCNGEKLHINNISVRYINFIDYTEEKISELLKIVVENPFAETINQSFVHLNFNHRDFQNVDINIFTAYPVQRDNEKCVVLDNILNQKQNNVTDYELIKNDFTTMRKIKNYIFFTAITEYTLNKYR